MIFGFNTDATHDGVVYHVQSEAREKDLLLQSQVFVQGRCIGKRACSYASTFSDVSESRLKETLKTQHRTLLDAIRDGSIEAILSSGEEIQDLDSNGLALRWVNSDETLHGESAKLNFRVTDQGQPVQGAELKAQMGTISQAPVFQTSLTDSDGSAEILVKPSGEKSREVPLFISVTSAGKRATRKFRLRRTGI